jgi:hypothetical protein
MSRPPEYFPRLASLVLSSVLLAGTVGHADPIDQARRIHDRLVGVPASAGTLTDMLAFLPGQPLLAAERAMEEAAFYNVALTNFVTPWTNEEQTVFAELNDYTALVVGLIRDELDFRLVLTGDVAYIGNPNDPGVSTIPYSQTDNAHYVELEANRVDLSDAARLVRTQQSSLPGTALGAGDAAGVITTRAAGKAFFRAGTNRRMFRFTSKNFLCRDLEQLKDVSREADRIRQDVNRSPGGDSEIFHTQCVGCHSGMDPLAGAFAYFEWDPMDPANEDDGRVVFTPGSVQQKYLINANSFPGGYITQDDRWDNFWRNGVNASLGWNGPASGGFGPKSFGDEIANSRAFSVCQVEKVFEHVCFRPPRDETEVQIVRDIADDFEAADYRMKTVFARVAVHCMGN